jgi:oligopeptide transport system substrate-binding protein
MQNKLKGVFLATAMASMALTACGSGGSTESASSSGSGSADYTLREFTTGAPTNWNPHTWEMNVDDDVLTTTNLGLVDLGYDPDTGGYKWYYEMATAIEDVTSTVDVGILTTYGIVTEEEANSSAFDQTALSQRVWKIDLNQNAKWQDGTAITADDYVESMKRLLDPDMKNYRANTYYSGETAVVGAGDYYNGDGSAHYIAVPHVSDYKYATAADDKYYISWDNMYFWEVLGVGWADLSTAQGGAYDSYVTVTDSSSSYNIVDQLMADYPEGTELTESNYTAFADLYAAFGGSDLTLEDAQAYFGSQLLNFARIDYDGVVGVVKIDDYSFYYITAQEVSKFYLLTNFTEVWLVKTDLYDSLITETNGLKTTTYGTSVDTYQSYGPYKMTSFQADRQIRYERNENWYGWTDGNHEGQYQATAIVIDIVSSHETAVLGFRQGNYDWIDLENADISEFGESSQRLDTPETYTERLVMDHNLESLQALEATYNNGANVQILSNYSFRKAISLMIDRERYNNEGALGHSTSFGILNTLYYYDVENDPNSVYRDTDEAKDAICRLYGMEYGEGQTYATVDEAYDAVTGLDVAQAKELFTQAYNEAVADGIYTDGQDILLHIGYYDASQPTQVAEISLLNEFVATATEGTPLEGKITFEGKSYSGDVTRYDAIAAGNVEIADCAWGGAAFYPFSTLEVYLDPSLYDIQEADSFDPTTETLTLEHEWVGSWANTSLSSDSASASSNAKTQTWQKWCQDINDASNDSIGGAAPISERLWALSELEYQLLNRYEFAILGSYGSVSLYSYKIDYPVHTYNIMYGYGGMRFLQFNYNDADWEAYVASQGGTLNYQ